MKQVVAEIAKDNSRMLATFRNRGFQINFADGAGRGDGDEGAEVKNPPKWKKGRLPSVNGIRTPPSVSRPPPSSIIDDSA